MLAGNRIWRPFLESLDNSSVQESYLMQAVFSLNEDYAVVDRFYIQFGLVNVSSNPKMHQLVCTDVM